jgi:uncharacterized protein
MSKHNHFNLALVTGASSGIGEALACLLASKGIPLILAGRDEARLKELSRDLPVPSTLFVGDLCNDGDRAKLVALIHEKAPDLIINNAGYGIYGEALTHETSEQLKMLQLDGAVVLELSLEGARTLVTKGRKGVIVNISSAAAWPLFPCFAVYSAAKAFVNQFSASFDEEVSPYGIRVIAACPGMVATRFRERAGGRPLEGQGKHDDVMSSDYAAEQIWNQILSGKKIRIFDLKTRFRVLAARYLIPDFIVSRVLKKQMNQRYPKREIIKIPHD